MDRYLKAHVASHPSLFLVLPLRRHPHWYFVPLSLLLRFHAPLPSPRTRTLSHFVLPPLSIRPRDLSLLLSSSPLLTQHSEDGWRKCRTVDVIFLFGFGRFCTRRLHDTLKDFAK